MCYGFYSVTNCKYIKLSPFLQIFEHKICVHVGWKFSVHDPPTQLPLTESGTFINQSRTKFYTNLVRSCTPNSYEVAYQTRTRLVDDGSTL